MTEVDVGVTIRGSKSLPLCKNCINIAKIGSGLNRMVNARMMIMSRTSTLRLYY